MSWNPALPLGRPDDTGIDTIEALIIPRSRGPGGSEACRALLAPTWQMIGSLVFFDQAGPAELLRGRKMDVHPHIGPGTVTCLFQGDFPHRALGGG